MKLLGMILLLHVLVVYAQDECEFKLYVDSLHGFSMEIPEQEEIIDKEGATYRYEAVESGNFKYSLATSSIVSIWAPPPTILTPAGSNPLRPIFFK